MNPRTLGISSSATTRTFSLVTYLASEQPTATFNYEIFNGELDIFITDALGSLAVWQLRRTMFSLVKFCCKGFSQVGRLNLSAFANQPGLILTFSTRTDNPTRVNVGEVTMVLADGSRVNSLEPNSTYASVAVPSTTSLLDLINWKFDWQRTSSIRPSKRSDVDTLVGHE